MKKFSALCLTGALVSAAFVAATPAFAEDDEPFAACVDPGSPLTVTDGRSPIMVTQADGNAAAEEGSYVWAVDQANATPGVDEIVIAAGVVIENIPEDHPIVESAILRGEDATSGILGLGVITAENEAHVEYESRYAISNLTLYSVEDQDNFAGILDLKQSCGNVLSNIRADGNEGILIHSDGTKFFHLTDSSFSNHVSPNGFDYGGMVTVNTMVEDPSVLVRGVSFTDNAGGAMRFLTPLRFTGEAGAGVTVADSIFARNTNANEPDYYTTGTLAFNELVAQEKFGETYPKTVEPLLNVVNTTFADNTALDGGGISVLGVNTPESITFAPAVVNIEDASFVGNNSEPQFGPTIRGNAIAFGGYLTTVRAGSALAVTNSTFANPNADGQDLNENGRPVPSISVQSLVGDVAVQHATFTGPAIDIGLVDSAPASLTVSNSAFESGDVEPIVTPEDPVMAVSGSHNAYTNWPTAFAADENSLVTTAADFALGDLVSTAGPTPVFIPAADSALIDAAASGGPSFDQRGLARPQGDAADIGSVEREVVAPEPEPEPEDPKPEPEPDPEPKPDPAPATPKPTPGTSDVDTGLANTGQNDALMIGVVSIALALAAAGGGVLLARRRLS